MKIIVVTTLFLVIIVDYPIFACHNPFHGVDPNRYKRSDDSYPEHYHGYNNSALITYFTECMLSRSNSTGVLSFLKTSVSHDSSFTFDWYSATVWTINDSVWFYYTDNNNCLDEDYYNETSCWISNVDSLFDETLSPIVKECINQFAIDNNFPVTSSEEKRRKKRSVPRRKPSNKGKISRNSECPSIPPAYDTELRSLVPTDRERRQQRSFNISNVVTFVDLFTVCTSECERYSGEPAVDCYANRLNQLTRTDSSIKEAIQITNARYANGGNTVGNCRRNVYKTEWFDSPLTLSGDNESLAFLRQQHPNSICKTPRGIQAELSESQRPFGRGNNVLRISPKNGLLCLNREQQNGICQNYRVRFCCKSYVGTCSPRSGWTPYYNTTRSVRRRLFQSLNRISGSIPIQACPNPTGVEARTIFGKFYQLSLNILQFNPARSLLCNSFLRNDLTCNSYQLRFCCPAAIGVCADGHEWTKWYKGKSSSKGFNGRVALLRKSKKWQCKSTPSAIKVQLAKSRRPYAVGGNRFKYISPAKGVLCLNKQQSGNGSCKIYRVRFCCRLIRL